MNKQNTLYTALAIMLISSLACNLGGTTPGSNGIAPTAILEQESSGVTPPAIPEPVETAPTAIPEPLPSGYMELLQNKIASGEWTQEEGLVILLKMFVGEIPVSEVGLGQGVKETEGTGILLLASVYLQTGTDQAAKDEIIRLLNLLVPSQESLDRYSIPEEQASSGGGPVLAAPAMQDPFQCESLWTAGFPDVRTPSFPCFLFHDLSIAGNSYKVYYPLAWRGDESRNRYYQATLEAIQSSIAQYKTYGDVKSIYFVFTTLADEADTEDSVTAASTATAFFKPATEERLEEACPVIINPAAMSDPIPFFKFTIAHEIFHCFQAWNLHDQHIGPGKDSWWWGEGTAEYFANLVYPSVNAEYDFRDSFSEKSTDIPLMKMDYENFAFFQFMGNRISPVGVIAMLRTMPTTPGLAAQLAALAAVPDMENTFEEFARAVIDNTIMDSDGSAIIFPEKFTEEYIFTDLSSKYFYGHPFVVARYLVSFTSEKIFTVETSQDGTGRSAWRTGATDWGPFPATAASGCEDLPYDALYVITTTPAVVRTEIVTTTNIADASSEETCDQCLIGRWEAANVSIVSYMQSVVDKGGADTPTVESVSGTMFMEFGADGTGAGGYENLIVHETGVGVVASTEVLVTFDGFSSGPYTANGSSLTGLSETTDILVTVQIPSLGSTTVPFNQEDFPVSTGVPTLYTCEGDTLTMWPPTDGATPIIYIRTGP